MFCPKCGTQMADGAPYCKNCGAKLNGRSIGDKVNHLKDDLNRGINGTPNGERLETDRNLLNYILLSIITCGIYSYIFIYSLARDVNIVCKDDGQKTTGLVRFIFFNWITCGVYGLYWEYSIANRLAENAKKYGMEFQENGTTILLWCIVNIIGSFVAMNILMRNTNRMCDAYNKAHGL